MTHCNFDDKKLFSIDVEVVPKAMFILENERNMQTSLCKWVKRLFYLLCMAKITCFVMCTHFKQIDVSHDNTLIVR